MVNNKGDRIMYFVVGILIALTGVCSIYISLLCPLDADFMFTVLYGVVMVIIGCSFIYTTVRYK